MDNLEDQMLKAINVWCDEADSNTDEAANDCAEISRNYAKKFAEWCEINEWRLSFVTDMWWNRRETINKKHLTTEELMIIFDKSNP